MATNTGTRGMRSHSPTFLQIALVVVIIVLLYSYWSVSSRNSKLLRDQTFLQQRLRSLAGKKITIEKKSASLLTQLSQLADEKNNFESAAKKVKDQSTVLNNKLKGMENVIRMKKSQMDKLQTEGGKYKKEVSLLRDGITGTTTKLSSLKTKARQLMEKYKAIKTKYETLLKSSEKAVKERDACQLKLTSSKSQQQPSDKKISDRPEGEKPDITTVAGAGGSTLAGNVNKSSNGSKPSLAADTLSGMVTQGRTVPPGAASNGSTPVVATKRADEEEGKLTGKAKANSTKEVDGVVTKSANDLAKSGDAKESKKKTSVEKDEDELKDDEKLSEENDVEKKDPKSHTNENGSELKEDAHPKQGGNEIKFDNDHKRLSREGMMDSKALGQKRKLRPFGERGKDRSLQFGA